MLISSFLSLPFFFQSLSPRLDHEGRGPVLFFFSSVWSGAGPCAFLLLPPFFRRAPRSIVCAEGGEAHSSFPPFFPPLFLRFGGRSEGNAGFLLLYSSPLEALRRSNIGLRTESIPPSPLSPLPFPPETEIRLGIRSGTRGWCHSRVSPPFFCPCARQKPRGSYSLPLLPFRPLDLESVESSPFLTQAIESR